MAELLQFVITGITVGMIYALIALGFVLIWKSSGVANLALGQLVLISSWFTYGMLVQAGLPFWLGFLVVIFFALILGILLNGLWGLFGLLTRRMRRESHFAYGPLLALAGIVMIIWIRGVNFKEVNIKYVKAAAGKCFLLGDIVSNI